MTQIRRTAILIEASAVVGQDPIPGCRRDVVLMHNWLTSPAGGGWYPHEIRTLSNPNYQKIQQTIDFARDSDIFYIHYSGHGRVLKDGRRQIQTVMLGDGTEIDFNYLGPAASGKRTIMICDACRQVYLAEPIEEILVKEARFADYPRLNSARRIYEELMLSEPAGTFTGYSCSPGQQAKEHRSEGGAFTLQLLRHAKDWLKIEAPEESRSIGRIFSMAAVIVAVDSNGIQTPEFNPKSEFEFPFAIKSSGTLFG